MSQPSADGAARYAGGVALVAGGSGGIGGAICKVLAEGGADIALTYNSNLDGAMAAADAVRAAGRRAEVAQVDLSDQQQVADWVARSAEQFGGVHTAVYAAGPYLDMRFISQLEPTLFRDKVGLDIFGCYHLIHAALPHLRKARGAVVAISTPAVRRYAVKDILSAAPKAAIETIVRGVAAEEGRFGVRANCVGSGVLLDGMYDALVAKGDFTDRFLEATKDILALKRLGRASEVADAVGFLASDRASYITGQSLMVDGGFAL